MTCVLLPGLDGTGALHGDFVAALGLPCDVLTYPAALTGYDALRDWVAKRVPAAPVTVIAESFSGPLAVQLAASNPQITSLVFVASFAHAPRPAPVFAASALTLMPIRSRLACQLMQPAVMGRWASRGFTNALWRALKTVPSATLAARLKDVLRVDVRAQLNALQQPAMYLRAGHDRLVPKSAALPFARAGAHVTEIDGPHFLLQARPDAAAQAIRRFLDAPEGW